ncbi:alpha/beta hydrolase [Bacillus sp. ISL-39]|uniref:alpha/beta fold hydrolase n=1 Tax=Bacillus sp. ISL-39 TaxID=2819124 RepID=UPI001BE8A737|nr:alpha/beta hydrolase [Bacillus sp. ISL-39]MBT2639726.1 alpha/beta hydrolase [Bacillus sp. ISL-39]
MLDYRLYKGQGTEYIVLLHGIGGSSNIFYKQLKPFLKKYNIIAINMPGHGKSPDIDSYKGRFSFDSVVREILTTLDHLSIRKAHFVGVSLGTIIVHHLLQTAPGRVRSAVLGGAITKLNLFAKSLIKFAWLIRNFIPFMWLYRILAWILMPRGNHKSSRRFFIQEAYKMKRKNFLAWYPLAGDVKTTYSKVQEKSKNVPKLYISGAEDHMFVRELAEDLQGDESSELVILERCGHVCNIEKAEEFNELSLEFMDKHQVKKANIS